MISVLRISVISCFEISVTHRLSFEDTEQSELEAI